MFSRLGPRSVGIIRTQTRKLNFDTMFNTNPNRIEQIRKKYNSDPRVGIDNPTYMKRGPFGKAILFFCLGAVPCAVIGVFYGIYCMMFQKNKKSMLLKY